MKRNVSKSPKRAVRSGLFHTVLFRVFNVKGDKLLQYFISLELSNQAPCSVMRGYIRRVARQDISDNLICRVVPLLGQGAMNPCQNFTRLQRPFCLNIKFYGVFKLIILSKIHTLSPVPFLKICPNKIYLSCAPSFSSSCFKILSITGFTSSSVSVLSALLKVMEYATLFLSRPTCTPSYISNSLQSSIILEL